MNATQTLILPGHAPARRRPPRRDRRPLALAIVVAGVAAIGYAVTLLPAQQPALSADLDARGVPAVRLPVAPPAAETTAVPAAAGPEQWFAEARRLLDAGRYDQALDYLNGVRNEVREMPEALILVGHALLGKGEFVVARDFFNGAIDRNPTFADAYFGHAIASEGLGELDVALGGMRSFLHLQPDPDPHRLRVAQARAAIWEWETRLGRGEWGPTGGIPPGFTAEELKRDGRGVGTKVPLAGTDDGHGFSRYTIKHSDHIDMYAR